MTIIERDLKNLAKQLDSNPNKLSRAEKKFYKTIKKFNKCNLENTYKDLKLFVDTYKGKANDNGLNFKTKQISGLTKPRSKFSLLRHNVHGKNEQDAQYIEVNNKSLEGKFSKVDHSISFEEQDIPKSLIPKIDEKDINYTTPFVAAETTYNISEKALGRPLMGNPLGKLKINPLWLIATEIIDFGGAYDEDNNAIIGGAIGNIYKNKLFGSKEANEIKQLVENYKKKLKSNSNWNKPIEIIFNKFEESKSLLIFELNLSDYLDENNLNIDYFSNYNDIINHLKNIFLDNDPEFLGEIYDLWCHEVGHAVFNEIRPGGFYGHLNNPLNESYADIQSVFNGIKTLPGVQNLLLKSWDQNKDFHFGEELLVLAKKYKSEYSSLYENTNSVRSMNKLENILEDSEDPYQQGDPINLLIFDLFELYFNKFNQKYKNKSKVIEESIQITNEIFHQTLLNLPFTDLNYDDFYKGFYSACIEYECPFLSEIETKIEKSIETTQQKSYNQNEIHQYSDLPKFEAPLPKIQSSHNDYFSNEFLKSNQFQELKTELFQDNINQKCLKVIERKNQKVEIYFSSFRPQEEDYEIISALQLDKDGNIEKIISAEGKTFFQ